MRRSVAVCLAISTLGACRPEVAPSQDEATSVAELFFQAGLDEQLRLRHAAARREYRAALDADPTYLPAAMHFVTASSGGATLEVPAMFDSLAARVRDPGIAWCYARIAAQARGTQVRAERPEALSPVAKLCWQYVDVWRGLAGTDAFTTAATLLARYPHVPAVVGQYLEALSSAGRFEELATAARRYVAADQPPLVRAGAWARLAFAEHELGRDDVAGTAERAVRSDPAWGNAGFRMVWAHEVFNHSILRALNNRADPGPLARHSDSAIAMGGAEREAAAAAGDLDAQFDFGVAFGVELLDRGRIADAVAKLEQVSPLADSIADAGRRAYYRMRLGRAYVKRGRPGDGERELLRARSLVRVPLLPILHKEVEHNLLHLYESQGRDADARRAGEAFIQYAGMGGLHPVRMMSERDFALFLRARGFIDESRVHFNRMLADIDSLDSERFYAGEYRELTGDLDGARRDYQRALDALNEPVRALEGLVRVSLAMGDTAGARLWATRHDARRDFSGRPESAPLLPGVIARTGARAEARDAYDRARSDASGHGQLAAWAALTADLAAFDLGDAAWSRARARADSAASATNSVAAADVQMRASGIAAYAEARGGGAGADAALNTLRQLARASTRSAPIDMRAELHRLAGSALAARGRLGDALDAFRRAAEPLDSIAATIAMDPRQAAYRSAQRRVYDDAILAIAAHRTAVGATDAYAEWSIRRKGRAYATAFTPSPDRRPTRPQPGTAFVDYVVTDSTVVAFVATADRATIIPLSTPADAVVDAVRLLHRALDVRVGSMLDVARARYPLAVARELYGALVAPLEPLLGGARRLVFVPDGILGLVPFDALVTSDAGADGWNEAHATYLHDRYVVASAATLNVRADAVRLPTGRVVAVAPANAPGADHEVSAIARAVPAKRFESVQGEHATKRELVARTNGAGILHIAAHSEANAADPGESWIGLEPAGTDDGTLRATEIAAMRLNGALVVLSACETAQGRTLDGEGVLSVSRSFLRAGARATVATLWPVGSSAAEFAAEFYPELLRSGDAAVSLRAAKRAMRAAGAPAFAWAPYQLVVGPGSGRAPTGAIASAGR